MITHRTKDEIMVEALARIADTIIVGRDSDRSVARHALRATGAWQAGLNDLVISLKTAVDVCEGTDAGKERLWRSEYEHVEVLLQRAVDLMQRVTVREGGDE